MCWSYRRRGCSSVFGHMVSVLERCYDHLLEELRGGLRGDDEGLQTICYLQGTPVTTSTSWQQFWLNPPVQTAATWGGGSDSATHSVQLSHSWEPNRTAQEKVCGSLVGPQIKFFKGRSSLRYSGTIMIIVILG